MRDRLRNQAEGKSAKVRGEQKEELIKLLDDAAQQGDLLERVCEYVKSIKVVRQGYFCKHFGYGATHVTARCFKHIPMAYGHMYHA